MAVTPEAQKQEWCLWLELIRATDHQKPHCDVSVRRWTPRLIPPGRSQIATFDSSWEAMEEVCIRKAELTLGISPWRLTDNCQNFPSPPPTHTHRRTRMFAPGTFYLEEGLLKSLTLIPTRYKSPGGHTGGVCEPAWPSGKALCRLVSRRTSVRSASALLSLQKLWFMYTVL